MKESENDSTEALRAFAREAVDWMLDYLTSSIDDRIFRGVVPAEIFGRFNEALPEEGSSLGTVFDEFRREIVVGATHLQHSGNFAYIPNSASVVGIVADLLAATLNQNVSLVRGGPSAAAVEAQTVRWLQSLIGYPEEGGGVLTSGGSLANLMALALARERLAGGERIVFYLSEETHSSIDRGLRFLGIGNDAIRRIPTDDAFRMSPGALRAAIARERCRGVVVATAGTIGSGAVDPLEELADVCRRENLWLHVDGAYGALAAAAPSASWMRAGLSRADSISLDPHKWLFVPIDTSCLLVRDVSFMREFFTVVPDYLKVSASEMEGDVHHPMQHTVELSRRFRALRLWMVVKTYGARAIRDRIEAHLALARELASWIERAPDFELCAPVMTSTVCFRYVPGSDAAQERILDRLNRRPGLFLSPNRLKGRFTLRACITHWRTGENDVRRLWDACQEEARNL
ncbi:MAG TPA: aminotransferase class I/II-fold pyridoxal phosphate-dependent enzyme [Vicinamibacteria bacterium]|nr:aminotransferase class I/II-fold pyridoxal phosphate-dependent enzyme [Vicinamibacteria bacterium]